MNYEVINDIKPSFAEQKIIDRLTELDVIFEREVVFPDCINKETGMHLRFDFYFPIKRLLLEYDGKDFHADPEVKRRDRIKNTFAFQNDLKIIRISGINHALNWINKTFGVTIIKDKPKKEFAPLINHIIRKQDATKAKNKKRQELREKDRNKPKKTQAEIRAALKNGMKLK